MNAIMRPHRDGWLFVLTDDPANNAGTGTLAIRRMDHHNEKSIANRETIEPMISV